MDIFDLFPMGAPGLPGDRLARNPGEEVAAGVGFLLLPTVSLLVVLFAGVAEHETFVIAVMPLLASVLVFVVGRLLGVSVIRAVLFGMGSATMCLMANVGGLVLLAISSFFTTF